MLQLAVLTAAFWGGPCFGPQVIGGWGLETVPNAIGSENDTKTRSSIARFFMTLSIWSKKVATAAAILLPAGLGYAGAPDIEPSVELYAVYDEWCLS